MSLTYPVHGSNHVCIVGIDPGTTNLGFAALEFDIQTLQIHRLYATSFKSQQMVGLDGIIRLSHSERIEKIYAQKDNLVNHFRYFHPSFICCESPFYNRFRPSAYGPLVEILFAIRTAAIEYDPIVKFFTYAPSVIKKAVGAGAISGKDAVKAAILGNAELATAFTEGDLAGLDEHAIDAIGVAYTHLELYRKES